MNWQLEQIVEQLREARAEWRSTTGRARELGEDKVIVVQAR